MAYSKSVNIRGIKKVLMASLYNILKQYNSTSSKLPSKQTSSCLQSTMFKEIKYEINLFLHMVKIIFKTLAKV